MVFDDFQKHCSMCEKGKPCGKYHLYVLTIDPRLKVGKTSKKNRFRQVNPTTHEEGEGLYVGKCECAPKCRQSKHRTYNPKKETLWTCYCGKYKSSNLYKKYRDNPTSIHNFLKGEYGFLKPKLFKKLNPFETSAEAIEAEAKLAISLRENGYAVWAGDHDDKLTD
ncbi:MAG TPA: hypothetical protein EYQ73_04095 [Candidatus Poseidoniales archaeon]|nr:hypothetical protein [Candidatus Poseidoniales archaeon]HIL65414.1 hypothetical protein [Candidatus Poseidoniales archaeon]